ncbi:MAG: DUF4845 domain-containing protein [Sideroxyarcus sp.]|nr:DUF4845 domain-containing protein [Sideroxyarcus sp.]
MTALAGRQRGISFVGFLLIAVGAVLVAVMGMKVVPAYVHSAQIAQILKTIADDPDMQGASIKEIKESYGKRANVNYITDITAEDIEIVKDDGQLTLSTNYTVVIPLVGNATLVLEFNPSSS